MSSIDWKRIPQATSGLSSIKFLDFININNLTQLITKPTHIQGKTLDLLITSSPHKLAVQEPLSHTCDHNKIRIEINIQIQTRSKNIKYNFFYLVKGHKSVELHI